VPAATAPSAGAPAKAIDRLVISQATDGNGLPTVNPVERLHTLMPRNFMYDQLLTRDKSGIRPMLAESVEPVDPTRYRIVLRRAVKFHNGDALDAQSVAATFDFLARAPEAGLFKRYFVGYKESKVVDERTLEVVFDAPFGVFPAGLTQVPIFPASQMASEPARQLAGKKIVGTGPYKLGAFTPGQSVTMTAFDDCWAGKPAFREVVLKQVADPSARMAELASESSQIVGDVPQNKVAEVDRIAGAKLVTEDGIRVGYLASSPLKAPLDNPKVRQAIYHAIDRKGLAEGLFGKLATPSVSPAPMSSVGSSAAFPLEDFSRERARALLKEAGVGAVGFEIDVAQVYLDVAQVVQAQLKEVGIDATINPFEQTGPVTNAERMAKKPNPTAALHVGFDNIERDAYFSIYAYRNAPDGFLKGFGHAGVPLFDELFAKYAAASSAEEKARLHAQAIDAIRPTMPIVWLYHPLRVYGVGPGVAFTPRGDGQLHLQDVRPA
jgi:peptide/nickel transport system substrate-binding protein